MIACPSCTTSYFAELASLQPDGRRVRCRSVAALSLAGQRPMRWSRHGRQIPQPRRPDPREFPQRLQQPASRSMMPPMSLPSAKRHRKEHPGNWSRRRRRAPSNWTHCLSCWSISTRTGLPLMSTPNRCGRKQSRITRTSRALRRPASAREPSGGRTRGGYYGSVAPIVLDPVVVGWRIVAAERFDLCHDGSASEPAGLACDGASTRAEQHKGLSHRWPPGQTIAFARWLASPSARSSDVLVRFRNRGDPFADPR
jgi:predicted Zn finger-like uncharacterized protein